MVRSLAAILAALEFVAPGFEPAREASAHVRALAIQHELDPFTIIAVVRHESGWNPGAINPRSGAMGLGQILPDNYAPCRADPLGAECAAIKAGLLDWKYNLTETAVTLARWRTYCGKKVGSRLAIHWLRGYQGFDLQQRTTCGHRRIKNRWAPTKTIPKFTQTVLARRRELEKRFAKRR